MTKNTITLPLGEKGLLTILDVVANAMTYEASYGLLLGLGKVDLNKEEKSVTSLLDRISWFMRIAYISGFVDGVEVYEAAHQEGELNVDAIHAKIKDITSAEYSETISHVGDYLYLKRDIHPTTRQMAEIEEAFSLPRRLTYRTENGSIAARAFEDVCLEKLSRYENSGYEPEAILSRRNRPYINLVELFGAKLPENLADLVPLLQTLVDEGFESGYARGRKEEREAAVSE